MALRPPSFSSSSSSFSYGFTYDVFLSFRGSDTRLGFTGNLYKALCDSGIRTFIDDRELQGGDEITPSLVKAIEESRIAIPVFSNNYASSSFCLDELVHIIECVNANGRLVLPVFYNVDPSHVRHQTGSYGEALAKHEARFKNDKEEKCSDNMERLRKWKMALKQAANLSGHHFKLGNEYEHEFIGKIVKEVSNKINRVPLHVADYPVGLTPRVLQVKSLLDVGFDDEVHMVGINGVGGIGKTTLARAIYNLIADQFEGLCFLHNVRENSAKHGLEHLQEMLLSKTIGLNIKLGDVGEGIPIIKQRLHRKKVLLILDDVDELKQLQVMVGEPDWFSPGSRVIITTRDKHLLASHGIVRTYEANELNAEEALELLCWKAFKNNRVDSSYKDILYRTITYASGLPLALEVVGSNLFGKHTEEWKSTLDRYERIPNKEIQNILKVSFDALEEDEKSVFLDISCCFKGCKLAEVEDILLAHYGNYMKYEIGVLVEKSLIKIRFGDVTLHDLIEDMGKEIVRQESPKEPGRRSRLWFHEDIVQVLEGNTGTSQIEIIYLDFPLFEVVVEWKGDEFKKMENLRTLIIKNGRFSKGPKHLPDSLRVLEWCRYPSQDIPSDFCPKKLFICKLRESCLTAFKLLGSMKGFVNMKVLDLDRCRSLTRILDVSGLLNLKKISFEFCENLITIHHSVGFLNKLEILKAKGCRKLRSFPPMKLTSLQQLELSSCHSLKNFPEILGEMKNITDIVLQGTSIEELPLSFQNLTGLERLDIEGCFGFRPRLPSKILVMPKLSCICAMGCLLPKQNDQLSSMVSSNVARLDLPFCNILDEFLQIGITWFANVRELNLEGSNFTILPECLKGCRFLWSLFVDDCKWLREIRGIPPNLKRLSAINCKSLTSSCKSMLLNQELHEAGRTRFCLPGTARIPLWFEHQSRGRSISFWFRNKLPSIVLFVVCHTQFPGSKFHLIGTNLIINHREYILPDSFICNGIHLNIVPDVTYLYDLQLQDSIGLDKILLKDEWNHVTVTYGDPKISLPIESGIHIFKQKSSMADIQFTNPYKKRKLD